MLFLIPSELSSKTTSGLGLRKMFKSLKQTLGDKTYVNHRRNEEKNEWSVRLPRFYKGP